MNNTQNTNKRKDGAVAKIFKAFLIVFAGVTVALGVFYYLTSKRLEYHFANNGSLICTEQKEWGVLSGMGELNCFGIVPIVQLPTPKIEKLSPSGEIILQRP